MNPNTEVDVKYAAAIGAAALVVVAGGGALGGTANGPANGPAPGGAAGTDAVRPKPDSARAELHDRQGRSVGTAVLVQAPDGVLIRARFTGLPPGTHAMHLHEVGKCEPPFTSAGGHFNPDGDRHGFLNARGYHLGDLPNIHVPQSGALEVEVFAEDLELSGREALLDADGAALIIHADPDDYTTDPAGNAGDRIACGVVQR